MPANEQFELTLPAPPLSGEAPLIPARMVNEFVYCPRLAYLMWTQGEWSETGGDTVEGRGAPMRTSTSPARPCRRRKRSKPRITADKIVSRSLTLSSTALGVIAKLDVAEAEDGVVTPIDYKRGKRPHVAQGAYEPERIQVCLQGLLLEEHGYHVEEGVIYHYESHERVQVVLDDALRAAARTAVSDLRLTVSQGRIPPPLKDSPKCPRCALVAVCLPDEVRALTGSSLAPRLIAVPADEALPLVVQSQHARIGKEGETLKITDDEQGETRVRFIDISDVALFGNVSITTPALSALFEREIPVIFHSHSGWFRGIAHGLGHRNVEVRTAQYRMSFDEASCLRFARDLVAAKIMNQRTILRRNWRGEPEERQAVLDRLRAARRSAGNAARSAELLGLEGDAAATYFRAFSGLLKQPDTEGELAPFRFESRNRRPPTDPVNAMLSLAYAMLARHLTIAVASVGLDPYRGFYHAPRYGRPALALDLMEPFRPIIADSVVLSAINTGEVGPNDFVVATTGTALTQAGPPPLRGGVRAPPVAGNDPPDLRLSGQHAPDAFGAGPPALAVSAGGAAELSPLLAALRREFGRIV
ncbi:MAG: CRISP-associated protein Cas1 [Rhodospirillaceae bacterium]|nr:MAG: CRISP-associated protein Cas1 [Rhodospirillaceae bacterium]